MTSSDEYSARTGWKPISHRGAGPRPGEEIRYFMMSDDQAKRAKEELAKKVQAQHGRDLDVITPDLREEVMEMLAEEVVAVRKSGFGRSDS